MNTYLSTPAGESEATASNTIASTAGQYLIFYLGREEYGIHVPRIREIISLIPLQLAPGLPYCVRGLVSILGKAIPVIDLRLKLGLPETVPANRPLKKMGRQLSRSPDESLRPGHIAAASSPVQGREPDSTWTAGEYRGGESDPDQYSDQSCIVMIDTGERRSDGGSDDRANRGGAALARSFDDPSIEFNFAGIVVDCISEIVNIRPEDIEPAAPAEGRAAHHCILGLVRVGRKTKTLLDIDLALNLDSWPEYAFSRTLAPLR
jgi:Chemotaxis signal transduction protein